MLGGLSVRGEEMKIALLIIAMMFAPLVYGQQKGDNYIASDDGEIVLFALPGCLMHGKQGLYGHAVWKTGVSEIICWQYDNVIYIYAPEKTIIFDPSEVWTRDVSEDRSSTYSALSPARFQSPNGFEPSSAPYAGRQRAVTSLCQPDWAFLRDRT